VEPCKTISSVESQPTIALLSEVVHMAWGSQALQPPAGTDLPQLENALTSTLPGVRSPFLLRTSIWFLSSAHALNGRQMATLPSRSDQVH
jgi:hypothetical protein